MIKKIVSLFAVPVITATMLIGCDNDRREIVYVKSDRAPVQRTVVHVQPAYQPYAAYQPLVFAPLVFGAALSFDDGYENRRLNNQLTAKDREIAKLRRQKREAYRKANNAKRAANRKKYDAKKAAYEKKHKPVKKPSAVKKPVKKSARKSAKTIALGTTPNPALSKRKMTPKRNVTPNSMLSKKKTVQKKAAASKRKPAKRKSVSSKSRRRR